MGTDMQTKEKWYNSRLDCTLFAVIALAFTLFFAWNAFSGLNEPLYQVRFDLQYAEEHRVPRRRVPDEYELYMYGANSTLFIVRSTCIERSEIQEFLKVLQPGAQIDLLTGGHGVRELAVNGDVLLSQELTAERIHSAAKVSAIHVSVWGLCSLMLWIRTAVLVYKKRMR